MKKEKNNEFLELLEYIKNDRKVDWKDFETNIHSQAFILLKFLSNSYKEIIDYQKAKELGRVKGDGKGKWPVKRIFDKKYEDFILLLNHYVNKNFWNIDIAELLIETMKFLYKINFSNDKNRKNSVIKKKLKNDKNEENIDDILKNVLKLTRKEEIEIIKRYLEKHDKKEIFKAFQKK